MKFIQLLDKRINLDNIDYYYPLDSAITEHIDHFLIKFVVGENWFTLTYTDMKQRDLDMATLDFLCVQNKRGNVKELQKVQQ